MKKSFVWLMLVLCTLFWAGNFVFGKFIGTELTPLWMTFSRWFFATMLLFPIAHFLERPNWKEAFKQWKILLVMGVLGYIGFNMILYTALSYTSSTNASLVSALNPAMIVILSSIVLHEKISRYRKFGIVVSLIGVIIVLTKGQVFEVLTIHYNGGDLLMLVNITVWAVYSLVTRRLKGIKPVTATAIAGLFAVLILLPFALIEGVDLSNLSNMAYIGMVYIIIFPSVGSFVFWNISVLEVGASKAGVFMNLIPVFTAIISVALGAELLFSQVVGGLFVLMGVYLTTGAFEQRFIAKKS